MKCDIKFRLCVPYFVTFILRKFQVIGKICRKSRAFLLKLTTMGLVPDEYILRISNQTWITMECENWSIKFVARVQMITLRVVDVHVRSESKRISKKC